MDDDDVQDTSVLADDGTAAKHSSAPSTNAATPGTSTKPSSEISTEQNIPAEMAPPKPPRPTTESQKNELILQEAFPSVDAAVIRAVLRASGGKPEPAFNALLGRCLVEADASNVRIEC